MISKTKTCKQCLANLSLSEFHRDITHADGHKTRCKKCRKAENPERARSYSREYYNKNSDLIKFKQANRYKTKPDLREYRLAHNRKRRADNRLANEVILRQEIIDKYGEICYLCNDRINLLVSGKPGSPGWEMGLHIDHVILISNGGSTTIENLRPTHGLCNLRRKKK